ncbi:hypothetical protein JRO89_XS12G0126200 [Xanthoceras sorbifolium]|uniref:U-box domain-containing protein n=1 Tax=Xanthoceras sorbifolium TaxID=99658 RepID=A0ABQ8HCM8_9ROSI|nr:hypothetical protein JRO89_XS12G0126200 [Xanthoceras sorbifolium]
MKDPVTAITGITYDRESIEHWLFKGKKTTCPVTKQPLPRDSDLTPNHTLRRLIQAWCTHNSVDRIPTPKTPLNKFHLLKLLKDLRSPQNQMKTLRQLEIFAAENERNRKYMVEVGVSKAILSFIMTCFDKDQVSGLEEALSILHFLRIPSAETRQLMVENDKLIESLTWVLGLDEIENFVAIKSHAVIVLKNIIETVSSRVLQRLKLGLFKRIVGVLRQGITQQGINAALHVLLDACPWGRNRIMMVESGAVFDLIELELLTPEKRTTELILGVLFHLCCCADGRAQFLNHKGGMAVVTRRILEVSPAADDRAILILSTITKFSRNSLVSQEMLKVRTVEKLCKLLQYDCAAYLKEKAGQILRSHYDDWKDSPCIDASFLARSTKL